MKKHSNYQKAILGLAIANCFLLLSCANNQNVDENGAPLDAAEQTVQDNGTGTDAGANKDQNSDLTDLDAAAKDKSGSPDAQTPPADAAAASSTPAPGSDASPTPSAGSEDLEKAMADQPGAGQPDATKTDAAATPPADASATPPAADAKADAGAGAGAATAANDATPPPAGGDTPPPPPEAGTSGELAPPPAADAGKDANPVADAAAASGASKHGAYEGAKVPHVRSQPLHKGNATLNRFYFVRKGDTPKTVSQLIYGTPDRAKNLKRWNKGAWKPGKLLYYQSANQPDDTAMKSFYEERGLTPEQYPVQRGDWISRIAKKKLGAAGSWKEIAVLNGLSSPDSISSGQNLAIYTDLSGGQQPPPNAAAQGGEPSRPDQSQGGSGNPPPNPYQQAQGFGQQPPPQGMPGAAAGINPPPGQPNQPPAQPIGAGQPPAQPVDQNPALGAQAQSPTAAPVNEPPPVMKKRARPEGVNVALLIQKNMFFIVMGLGISALLLLLLLLAINKRKRARADDFNEDGFGATAVKKRR